MSLDADNINGQEHAEKKPIETEEKPQGTAAGGEAAPREGAEEEAKKDKKDRKSESKKVRELEKLIGDMAKKGDELLSSLQRERADFDNYRRRNQSATADAYQNGCADTVSAILPVLDNFERALTGADGEDPFIKGMTMVYKQLVDALVALGLSEIEAMGLPFDPNVHNAVMQEEAAEGKEADMVCEVLSKGYRFKDKIIRHSMVKVTK